MIRAMYNNAKIIYEKNNHPLFPNGNVSHYFESFSDISDEEIIPLTIIQPSEEPYLFTEYVAPGYTTVEEMHSSILKRIYRPSKMVQNYLTSHLFLNSLTIPYIAMHVRWSDKIQGDSKETEFIPISHYLDSCNEIRNKTGISTIVLCCDTYDAISEVEKQNVHGFTILYNDEIRSKNTAVDSVVNRIHTNQLNQSELELEYLTCFVNMHILTNAVSIVGNYDSCFCLVAIQLRNKPDCDINVNTRKALWGIHNKF